MVKKKRQNGGEGDESTESCDETVKTSCPHVPKAVDLSRLKKILKLNNFEKSCSNCEKQLQLFDSEIEVDLTLWMCLRCGSQLCGRSRNKHALSHHEIVHSDCHSVAVNTTSWDIYCYYCKNEISPSSTKKLQECVEFLKKQANSGNGFKSRGDDRIIGPMEPINDYYCTSNSIPKDQSYKGKEKSPPLHLPRVRGLSNLGNTCFFNSVMQCLVQTPYLLPVLQEMKEPGERFVLPGGTLKLVTSNSPSECGSDNGSVEIEMPPIKGELSAWGNLAKSLAETLEELQSSERSDVYSPHRLLSELRSKHQQFRGGDQHDAHELLRHLLEAVRTEDLRRYQTIILENLGLNTKVHPARVEGDMKQKVKFYGNQASDTLLRPEQVFRGFLVSTLECQECLHKSDREEYFLDLSLPVAADRPQPPAVVRRKGVHEDVMFGSNGSQDDKPSKHQLKKERQAARKAGKKNKANRGSSGSKHSESHSPTNADSDALRRENESSSEQSDADVEDNLEEAPKPSHVQHQDNSMNVTSVPHTAANFAALMESGYNSEKVISSDSVRTSPIEMENKEKTDLTPERPDKESADFSAGVRASRTAIPLEWKTSQTESISNPDSGVASPEVTKNNSSDAVNNADSPIDDKDSGSQSSLSGETNADPSSPLRAANDADSGPTLEFTKDGEDGASVPSVSDSLIFGPGNKESISFNIPNTIDKFDNLRIKTDPLALPLTSNYVRVESYVSSRNNSSNNWGDGASASYERRDGSSHPFRSGGVSLSTRHQHEEGECSIQSCLNQFTAVELMTGNNKVGCENCTERINGRNGKTVYANATKRFLISSPPPVLILHLKRFQIGPRSTLRKMSKHVDFPVVLDLAPFCSERAFGRPATYSLYGVVEHAGGMHGGHYVAYAKVRRRRAGGGRRPPGNGNADEDSEEPSGYESGEGARGRTSPPPGRWYSISDGRVQEMTEERVTRAQAYLLFYERIL